MVLENEIEFNSIDWLQDPKIHHPIVLMVDSSWSMCGCPIEDVNRWINNFVEFMKTNIPKNHYFDLCIASFDSHLYVYHNFDDCKGIKSVAFSANNDRADVVRAIVEVWFMSRNYAKSNLD